MRLVEITRTKRPGGVRLTGTIEQHGEERAEVYFDYDAPESFVENIADAFAAAMLLPSMRLGEALEIDPPLSPQTCFNLPRIRDVFCTWWPHLSRSEIRTTAGSVGPPPAQVRAATFFSGGVDSFYSLLKHRRGAGGLPAPLTHVIFMRGIESRLHWAEGVKASEARVREIASATAVDTIVGESNIRTVLQRNAAFLGWETCYLGSALAAAALPLSADLAYVCIPAGDSYNNPIPWGTTALVDEMYSTERLRLIHDGAELTRSGKLAKILEWDRDLVLAHLRVCVDNRGGPFNCGKCYKCVRTAVALRILGAWADARTFPTKSTAHWERAMAQDHLTMIDDNLAFANERGADPEILAMLRRVSRSRRRRRAVVEFLSNSPLERLLPAARRVSAISSDRDVPRPPTE
jgi:hypothetical protein